MKKIMMMAAALAAGVTFGFELVGPQGGATLVVAEDCEESSLLAAQEITNYVARLTGVALKIEKVSAAGEGARSTGVCAAGGASVVRPPRPHTPDAAAGEGERSTIYIGTRAKFPGPVPAEALEKLNATKKTESYWTKIEGEKMWIVGWEEVAELYGAYHFLEKELGIRWFQMWTKEDPGDYVPTRESGEIPGWKGDRLTIAPYTEFREPSFTERRLDMCSAVPWIPAPRSQELYLRNGYDIHTNARWWPKEKAKSAEVAAYYGPRVPRRRANLGGGHMIFLSCCPKNEKSFKEHPEYFALVDGKRVMGDQHCYSNTNLLNLAADAAIKLLDSYNGLGEYCFALWDTMSGACQCEKCVAMATPDETKRGIESTRFHTFVNYIADRIWQKWPSADLLYLAYWTYRQPPAPHVNHDPRMPVQVCVHERCYAHAIDDPKCGRNAVRLKELKEWGRIAPHVFTYEYFTATPSHYLGGDLSFAHDLKVYHQIGLQGWKEEAAFADSAYCMSKDEKKKQAFRDKMPSTWQRYWIAGKLSWDITLDEKALLEECERKYYGPAYPAMKKYQDLRRKLWDNNRNCLGYPTGDQRTATLLNVAGAKEELLGYLDEAEKLVDAAAGEGARSTGVCAAGEASVVRPPRPHTSDAAAGEGARSTGEGASPAQSVYRHRVSEDRRWLTEYWIKPNEALREKAGKAMRAPAVAKDAITVDGAGDEPAWTAAAYAEDFLTPLVMGDGKLKPIPSALATSVGVCQDGENLYFLLTAKEPNPSRIKANGKDEIGVYGDDCFELFLFPPAMDNRYYHIAVNTKGEIYDAKCPGNDASWNLGITAKAKVLADRYVIEMKIPAKNMHPLADGETWTFNVARNRTISDDVPRGGWSLGGAGYHDLLAYRSLTIGGGQNFAANGSFENLDEKGHLKNWAIAYGGAKVVEENGNRFVRFTSDTVYEYLAFGQPTEPKRVRYTFRARGKGKISTCIYSFTDTPNARAKHGYDRKFNPTKHGKTFDLTPEWKSYTGEFTNPANEHCGLGFSNAGKDCQIDLDDIVVTAR